MTELKTETGIFLSLDAYNELMANQRRLLAIIEVHDERFEPCPSLGLYIPHNLVGIYIDQEMTELETRMGKSLPKKGDV